MGISIDLETESRATWRSRYILEFHAIYCLRSEEKGANHGYGALVSNLGRNSRLRRLGCRRNDRCGLAFGSAHGTTCRHSRVAQPFWVGPDRGSAAVGTVKAKK